MQIVRLNQVSAEPASGPLFTGPVTRQPIITGGKSKQFIVSQVNFNKGVRNKFHVHTSDQILIVTSGTGFCATDTEEVTVGPGDVILFPAGERHWHGATQDSAFSHIYVASVDNQTTQVEK